MEFKVGQRVTMAFYGKNRAGTVTKVGRTGIVFVLWDGKATPQWQHADSLKPLK